MIRTIATSLLLALATVAAFAGEPNTLNDAEKSDGWKLLFDGKTTDGWVAIGKTAFPEKGWSVQDGALFHAKGGGGGDIVTSELYENFELTWEWRIGFAGNSGLKYNLPNPAKNVGFEYQMIDDDNHPDGKRGGRKHQTASLYDLMEPSEDAKPKAVGDWNDSRLLVKGNHVEEWLNGVKSLEFEMGSAALKALIAISKFKTVAGFGEKTKSPILLQDHGDEVAVRSIRIHVLDGK